MQTVYRRSTIVSDAFTRRIILLPIQMSDDLSHGYDTGHTPVMHLSPRPVLRQRGLFRALRDTTETLILVATLYAFVNLATARFVVDGDSMLPTFHTGQYLIISRVDYLLGEPERGDVVVFHYPLAPENDFIKRVIGLPGETVALLDGQVFVDDVRLDEPYIREACAPSSCPNAAWLVGPNQYFMMGDNRNESRDSRAFGAVERRFIVGEVLLRYWPREDWGIVQRVGMSAAMLLN
jgi:signal peptidase I